MLGWGAAATAAGAIIRYDAGTVAGTPAAGVAPGEFTMIVPGAVWSMITLAPSVSRVSVTFARPFCRVTGVGGGAGGGEGGGVTGGSSGPSVGSVGMKSRRGV